MYCRAAKWRRLCLVEPPETQAHRRIISKDRWISSARVRWNSAFWRGFGVGVLLGGIANAVRFG